MKNVKKHYHLLKLLLTASPAQKRAIIRTADKSQLHLFCEICLNILEGNLAVDVKKLRKYKKAIRKIGNKKLSLKQKRKEIIQIGGALPFLIAPVLTALAGIIGKAIGNRI
ncbi:hypothetical protein TNCT_562971 [Trichonephila clavata]|uniref:Uncharacterized protein n=1 Tax=Trichonephila clavata TaxID=2740835 RepID=A0A8X6FMA9_TRICU|nr:hypothetical protein TNCT_562971 [Trichonephila clavata]